MYAVGVFSAFTLSQTSMVRRWLVKKEPGWQRNWIVNAIVGMTFLTLLKDLGSGNTFLLYGGLNVLFIIFFLLFVPETKGVSLEKIESNLRSGLPLRKIGR